MSTDVPDGMVLACRTCGWRPAEDLPVGMIQAHMQTEHDTDEVVLDLLVICPRCDKAMTFSHSERRKDIFACDPCHRIRSIRRTES